MYDNDDDDEWMWAPGLLAQEYIIATEQAGVLLAKENMLLRWLLMNIFAYLQFPSLCNSLFASSLPTSPLKLSYKIKLQTFLIFLVILFK